MLVVVGGGLAVGGMVGSVVGWRFCKLSTGWWGGTLRGSDEPLVGALCTERMFSSTLFLVSSSKSYMAQTKVELRLVFSLRLFTTSVTIPRISLVFALEPYRRLHSLMFVTCIALAYTMAPTWRLGSVVLLGLNAIVEGSKMLGRK